MVHEFSDEYVKQHSGEIEGKVEIFKEYAEGLEGIEEYSHIFLLSYLHKVREEDRRLLKIKPRRLLRIGYTEEQLPTIGVFSSDSPIRPNPIGLSLVTLLKRQENTLYVKGLDLFNNTPIIDLKPLRPSYTTQTYKTPKWVEEYEKK